MTTFRTVLLAVALLVVTSCSSIRGERVESGFGSSIDPGVESALTAGPASAPAVVSPDPIELGDGDASASFDFQARELYSGSLIEGGELFGQGKVLVVFVQPGCDITVDGGPTIANIAEVHPEAVFVIVHSGADDEAYRAFAEESLLFQENVVHLSDTHGSIAKRYNVEAYPTTLLIDSELRITAVSGAMDRASLRAAVETATMRGGANS